MKDKLVLLVGPSGVGKTAIAKALEKEGFNIIHSYTTRKPRGENEWGHTFVHESDYKFIPQEDGNIYIAKIGEKSVRGNIISSVDAIAYLYLYGNHYWATKEQYKNKGTSVYVVCPGGAREVQENVTDAEVLTIFFTCDEAVRKERLIFRYSQEGKETGWDITDVLLTANERIEKDREAFKVCSCDYTIDVNRPIKEVLSLIKNII